jgi:uncharacterized membrane protein YcaP (DUF421 family)
LDKDEFWLNKLLKENNIEHAKDVFLGIIDSKNKFYYQFKEGRASKK